MNDKMQRIETVHFMGDEIAAAKDGDKLRVVLKPLCDALGLSAASQIARLEKVGWATPHRMTAVGADGKTREMLTLDLDSLPMWLATIQVTRVSKGLQAKLLLYQRGCAKVLRDHFFGVPPAPPSVRILDSGPRMSDSPEGKYEVRKRCTIVARACDRTLKQVLGFVQRMARTSSPYHVSDIYWRDRILALLDEIAMGHVILARGKTVRGLLTDTRQQKLFGSN